MHTTSQPGFERIMGKLGPKHFSHPRFRAVQNSHPQGFKNLNTHLFVKILYYNYR